MTTKPLKKLRKIYVAVHASGFLDVPPGSPNRQEKRWEQWPGRCDDGYRRTLELLPKWEQLIREAQEDEGIFFIGGAPVLLELAREHFGSRCVVWREDIDLGPDFAKGQEEDRQQARSDCTEHEIGLWNWWKSYAVGFQRELEKQGYTFDPAKAEFVAFGGDWCYCCGSYPIHMARAWGLAKGITRPFDLICPSASPLLINATVVEQNLPMPENIDLFILKTPDEGPTWGRYAAQYYERAHGPMDPLHVVEVDFPADSVEEINIFGWPLGRAIGIDSRQTDVYGHIEMSVGCGGHTTHAATLVLAKESLSLEDFRAALLAGKVSEVR